MISALISWGIGFGGVHFLPTHGLGKGQVDVHGHLRQMSPAQGMAGIGTRMKQVQSMSGSGPKAMKPAGEMIKE